MKEFNFIKRMRVNRMKKAIEKARCCMSFDELTQAALEINQYAYRRFKPAKKAAYFRRVKI